MGVIIVGLLLLLSAAVVEAVVNECEGKTLGVDINSFTIHSYDLPNMKINMTTSLSFKGQNEGAVPFECCKSEWHLKNGAVLRVSSTDGTKKHMIRKVFSLGSEFVDDWLSSSGYKTKPVESKSGDGVEAVYGRYSEDGQHVELDFLHIATEQTVTGKIPVRKFGVVNGALLLFHLIDVEINGTHPLTKDPHFIVMLPNELKVKVDEKAGGHGSVASAIKEKAKAVFDYVTGANGDKN